MAQSLIERINNLSVKSNKNLVFDENLFNWGRSGLDASNHDFTYSEYGAAQASQLLVDISASLNVWELWLDGITWHIKDVNTGESLLTTDQRTLKDENVKGARFFKAIKKFRERYKHSYWKSIAISDWITGETYIRRVRNGGSVPTELQWMNPLATEPYSPAGKILHYSYYNDDMQEVGYLIPVQDMAFRMLRRNLFDDLRGLSPILSVIDDSNLSRNVKRAFRQYFRNGMILGGIVSPDNPEAVYSQSEQDKIVRMLRQNNQGVDNAHSWIISPKKILVQAFDSKDAGKDIQVLDNLRGSIMMALGVPEELAGNPTQATYENLEATLYNWYKLRGIPYARDIAEYHNNQIIPFIDGSGIYIEPELSKYEIERPEVVSQDVTAGVISLYDAQVKRGKTEADETLENIYIINGRPMHRDVIVKLASTFPSEEIEQRASAEESLSNATMPQSMDGEGEAQPQSMQPQYDENGTAIPQAEVFGYHIDSGIVDINEARAQLGLPPIDKETASDTDLVQLNSQLQTVITAMQAGMTIDEAYESVGLPPPKKEPAPPTQETGEVEEEAPQPEKSVTISHGDHSHEYLVEHREVNHDATLNELKAWKKFRKNDPTRNFTPNYLLGDLADSIRTAIEAGNDVESAFDSAFDTVKSWQKAIQAVRLDFENDFDEIMARARDDSNNYGRRQWSTAMRSIIRRYCPRAFSDGLVTGGVLDGELSESDQDIVASHIAEQSTYVTQLGEKIFKTEEGITDALAEQKAAMWFRKSIQPMFDAGRESADANGMYEFAGDDGQESCTTCIRLKGQRHRLKSWSRKGLRPGVDTDNFDCGGWQCDHKLVKVAAKARGRW